MTRNRRGEAKRRAGRLGQGTRFPAATVAYYGPDDQHATKVVIGVVLNETADVGPLERWFSSGTDVRNDPIIAEQIGVFLQAHGVRSVVATDRIIGCPHEEGVDYPEGAKCPRCPFWATRDRWSGDVIQ